MAGKDIIMVSREELKRLHYVREIEARRLRQVEAAAKLKLSERQMRRIVSRFRCEGERGVIHRLRGRSSNRKIPESVREAVIELYRSKYAGFGPLLLSEKLAEEEQLQISDETLRQWLLGEGLWEARRKKRKHRKWRQRKARFGEMLQLDGSHHAWFEDRAPQCVLMELIDDARSIRFSRFYEYEGTLPALDLLMRYIRVYGIPQSIYLDRHSTYKSQKTLTIEEELSGTKAQSQFERAAGELGIEIIHAKSAPAKGRIERSFKTHQDRLVKEMRLRGISSLAEGNKFLAGYLPKYNKRFSVPAAESGDLHQAVPKGLKLAEILCIKSEHPVRNDWTIVHNKQLYQIVSRTAAKNVEVQDRITGAMYIMHKGCALKYRKIQSRPLQAQKHTKHKERLRMICRPPSTHPWKQAFKRPSKHQQQQLVDVTTT